jgi:uncharacterized protein RhaS with RHS repeats
VTGTKPVLGRLLQPDPIRYGDGMNMYGYAGGDPVNATDPSGEQASGMAYINVGTIYVGDPSRGSTPSPIPGASAVGPVAAGAIRHCVSPRWHLPNGRR